MLDTAVPFNSKLNPSNLTAESRASRGGGYCADIQLVTNNSLNFTAEGNTILQWFFVYSSHPKSIKPKFIQQ